MLAPTPPVPVTETVPVPPELMITLPPKTNTPLLESEDPVPPPIPMTVTDPPEEVMVEKLLVTVTP